MGVSEKQQFLLSVLVQVMQKHEKRQLNRSNLICITHIRNIEYTGHGPVHVSVPNF